MRGICAVLMMAGLVACTATVPDSAQGVGFEDYDTYLAQKQARDAQLRAQRSGTQTVSPASQVTTATTTNAAVKTTAEQKTAQDAVAAVRSTRTAKASSNTALARGESVPAGIKNTAPGVPNSNNPTISDEQDFQAVSSRQSIESDAARRKAQNAQYKEIAPTSVPRRPGNTTQTPIEYALATSHPVGQKVYRRSVFSARKSAKACAGFRSGELAQDAFLKAGGPQKDKLGVDPDGDGYACGWNPGAYRGLSNKG